MTWRWYAGAGAGAGLLWLAQLLLLSLLSVERLDGAGSRCHAVTRHTSHWPGVTCGVTSCYTCHVSPVAPECDVRRLAGSGGEV